MMVASSGLLWGVLLAALLVVDRGELSGAQEEEEEEVDGFLISKSSDFERTLSVGRRKWTRRYFAVVDTAATIRWRLKTRKDQFVR